MRLRQLARKIDKQPAQIVSFLAERGIVVEMDDNEKVEDLHADLVISHFAPELKEAPAAEPLVEPAAIEPEPVIESVIISDTISEISPTVEASVESTIELIKAPKVELSGLKVLGKIELPEPKKKEVVPTENEEMQAQRVERRDDRRRGDQRRQQSYQPRKNPITLQREKEIREEEEKREEERKRQKELKALHYEKKMNERKVTRPMKKIYQEELREEEPAKIAQPAPKTILGKIARWFNT